MLIKIQGLPFKSKYQDVKVLVRSECTITDFKLDNLVVDNDGTKKVLVTVGNEAEAFCLIKCLNGYRMSNNCVLSVESMSTQKSTELNPSPQNTFEQRPGSNYQQPRSDYPNQMANEYNRGPHSFGQSGPHMPQRPVEAIGTRNEGWNSGNGPGNQWSHNQSANPQGSQSSGFPGTPIYPQHPSMPQRVESYTGNRPQQSANYGYPLKNNIPNAGNHQSSRQDIRSNDMRNTDATLTHGPTGRYPPSFQQEKPITIMKDNFQGPTMYQLGSNSGTYQGPAHGAPQIWNQGQEPKNQGYAKSNPLPYEKYDDDRRHPQSDKRAEIKGSQEGMRMTAYKNYEKSRQFSPTRRNLPGRGSPPMKKRVPSPHAASTREMLARRLGSPERKISPMGVAMSGRLSPPIRNMSPPIRRVSPSGRWVSATRPVSPPGRRVSPSGRRGSPTGRRVSPTGRRSSPTGRRVSPSGRRVSPPGRRGSPSERRISPSSRRMSPLGGRVVAPNMRVSPTGRRPVSLERPSLSGRRISPSRMASRHISPPGRRVSPSERRMSPSDSRMLNRRVSPRRPTAQKRGSPDRRLESPPPRAGSRQAPRYSPRHHIDDKVMEPKMDIVHKSKQVRPAYESQASSQAMYSGGYRQNLKENISYPISGTRQPEQRSSPWHQVRDKNTYVPLKKQEDDRRDLNEKRHPRQSHSPVHRERSPIRDNYRTSSPVSRSPRRSWALEKRPYCRSPEAAVPPPPTWPGNKPRDEDLYKNKFNRPEDIPKHPLVWERPPVKMENPKRLEEPRGSEDKLRGRGIPQRDMGPTPYDQNQREPKFNPRHEFDDNHKEEYQRQRDMLRRSPDRREFREAHPRAHEERRHDEFRRLPSPRREEPKKPEFQEFDKDFEDIYKRAQEFRKKAEQLRRPDERRRDEHVPENHHESHRDDKYDSRRERSPHRRPELDHHEPERRYDESKYKDSELRDRESDWKEKKPLEKAKKFMLLPHVKTKRDKATDDILGKIMRKYKQIIDLTEDQRNRVAEELKLALARLLLDMFGENDVSFIEMVIKYDAKISGKQEEAMVHDVLKCLPSLYRRGKRSVPEPEGLSKMARYSPESAMKGDFADEKHNNTYVPDWHVNVEKSVFTTQTVANIPPQLVTPHLAVAPFDNFTASGNPQQFVASQMIPQMMLPLTMSTMVQFVPTYAPDQFQGHQDQQVLNSKPENYKLFLCKDDFEPFTDMQAELLKGFLVSQIIKVTETSQGWAPDLTLKGINTVQRYEVSSKDEASKDWLVNLDFSDFKPFIVLVYTDEELWYERAAIWLPGHSKCRHIEPLDKLKLQNKQLEGVNIGKWKMVKKVMNEKGTRLYVDMPSSSSQALEKYKMMLSYELQKVNVILKARAVDKNSFDAGLKERSLINPSMLANAIRNSPMPSLAHDSGAVQMTLKGNTTITIDDARKLKETIIYHLFMYLKNGGLSKIDFVKYGSFPPNYFGIVPENPETKRWLLSTQFGKVNRRSVVVIGGDDSSVKFFRMHLYLPVYGSLKANLAIERLRRSNQGVKGINFHLWRPCENMTILKKKKQMLDVEVDLESVETLKDLKFQLDYVDDYNETQTVLVSSKYSQRELEAVIKTYKDEMTDSYDVANMELESSDDDVICLD